jgi:hypothetical protein
MLDALGRPAPSSEVLRKWYGNAAWANVEAARWVYRVVGALREPDLGKLDLGELMSFWVRFENWGAVAKGLAVEVRHKIAHGAVGRTGFGAQGNARAGSGG